MTSQSKNLGHLWVVLPAYNEAENLPPLVESLDKVLGHWTEGYHILAVNDGSSDDTAARLDGLSAQFPLEVLTHETNRGLGPALQTGFAEVLQKGADHDFVAVMDADNTHPPEYLEAMSERARAGMDVVVASRFQSGGAVIGLSRLRRLASQIASMLYRVVFPTKGLRDYTCGYRLIRVATLRKAAGSSEAGLITENGFACTPELLLKLRAVGARFAEVPFIVRYDRKMGASKMKIVRTSVRSLLLLIRLRLSS